MASIFSNNVSYQQNLDPRQKTFNAAINPGKTVLSAILPMLKVISRGPDLEYNKDLGYQPTFAGQPPNPYSIFKPSIVEQTLRSVKSENQINTADEIAFKALRLFNPLLATAQRVNAFRDAVNYALVEPTKYFDDLRKELDTNMEQLDQMFKGERKRDLPSDVLGVSLDDRLKTTNTLYNQYKKLNNKAVKKGWPALTPYEQSKYIFNVLYFSNLA